MRIDPAGLSTNLALFYGLLAAPLAWTCQLVVGYGIGEAACSPGSRRWDVDSTAGELALTVAAVAIALTGLATAIVLHLEQRREGGDERGRIAFMAGGGILVSAVFVALILLGGIASLSIAHCHQS